MTIPSQLKIAESGFVLIRVHVYDNENSMMQDVMLDCKLLATFLCSNRVDDDGPHKVR
jgi:hypothetical protein